MSTPPTISHWVQGGGGWASYQILEKVGAFQDLNFERVVAGKEGGDFFQGVAVFSWKVN